MIKGIDHVAIAVKDLEAAAAFFRDALGLTESGREEVHDQKVRLVFFDLAGVRIELLESTSPDGPIAKFIEKRGPGLHHLTLKTGDIDEALGKLAELGIKLIDTKAKSGAEGSRIAFIHPHSTGGSLIELCQRPSGPRKIE